MEDEGRLGAPGLGTVALTAVPAVVWGSTYAVTQLWLPPDRPFFAAAARVLPAGLLLLLWVRRLPRGRWWGRSLALGALNHGIFFALLYVGAYRLPSGLGSTLTAISPLIVMATAFLVLRERQPWVTVAAAVAGIGGVGVLVWSHDRAGAVDPIGLAAALGAVLASSVGFVLVKRWSPPDDVIVTTSWQLVAGGLLLVPLDGPLAEEVLHRIDADEVFHLVAVAARLTRRRAHAAHHRRQRVGIGQCWDQGGHDAAPLAVA